MINVKRTTSRRSEDRLFSPPCVKVSRMRLLLLRLGRPPAKSKKIVDRVMMPNPPIWIMNRTINWPKNVRSLPISTTTSPVTQAAEVAVKRASTRVSLPLVEARGVMRSAVPRLIREANPTMLMVAGRNFLRSFMNENLILMGLPGVNQKREAVFVFA
jgi:hypothetical protein